MKWSVKWYFFSHFINMLSKTHIFILFILFQLSFERTCGFHRKIGLPEWYVVFYLTYNQLILFELYIKKPMLIAGLGKIPIYAISSMVESRYCNLKLVSRITGLVYCFLYNDPMSSYMCKVYILNYYV